MTTDPRFVLSIFGLIFLLLVVLSTRWATRKERTFLGKSLGHPIRPGEEDSFETWLKVPAEQMEEEARELAKNPFNPLVTAANALPATGVLSKPDQRDCMSGIADLRRRRRARTALVMLFLPAMILVRVVFGLVLLPFALAWLVATVWINNWVVLSVCPRCGQLFHGSRASRRWAPAECMNCGLPLYGADDGNGETGLTRG